MRKNMETNELYLKTAFCCMACDGNIAQEEVDLLNRLMTNFNIFDGLDIKGKLDEYVSLINDNSKQFLCDYIEDIKLAELNDEEALRLVKIAIATIEADEQIDYSEISFFKKIRKNLAISDEAILEALPDKEDYLLPDIADNDVFEWNIKLPDITIDI